MNLHLKELSEKVGCVPFTLRQYLDRPEFSHITRKYNEKRKLFELINITPLDISRLRKLIYSRRPNKRTEMEK